MKLNVCKLESRSDRSSEVRGECATYVELQLNNITDWFIGNDLIFVKYIGKIICVWAIQIIENQGKSVFIYFMLLAYEKITVKLFWHRIVSLL